MQYKLGDADISFIGDDRIKLRFAVSEPASTVDVKAITDVGESGKPISIEILGLVAKIGRSRLQRVVSRLAESRIKWSFDEDSDAFIANINVVNEDPKTQQSFIARFQFDNKDEFVGIELVRNTLK